jgi:peroxiredoxin
VIQEGQPAPSFRAPSSKGHTLQSESFQDRLAIVLFFLDGLEHPDDQLALSNFDELLVEFGHRRVQLLGVAPVTARELREATESLAVPLLADKDGSLRREFGGLDIAPFTVVIDRHGTVARVLPRYGTDHAREVLTAVDALLSSEPDAMRAKPEASAERSS